MKELHFEDFRAGDVARFGDVTVDRDAMVAFARDFDPQPFHVDEESARDTFVGQLIASGWYTTALQMRMICDAWMLRAAGMGSPGVDEVRWLKPVLAGDRLSVRQTVLETKTSRSRPEMGLIRFTLDTLNGADEPVMKQSHWVMLQRRGAEDVAAHGGRSDAALASSAANAAAAVGERQGPVLIPPFDQLEIGRSDDLGSYTFTPEEVVRFATQYDPQPFHVDEAAGRASPFGALAASGWHTAAAWMKGLVAHRAAAVANAKAAGVEPPRYGSSPGFKNLRWLKPVRAGDTIRYATTVADKRLSASRPGWGIVFSRNTGHNQHGELVFSFEGSGFMARSSA